jgi:hypothetical protein
MMTTRRIRRQTLPLHVTPEPAIVRPGAELGYHVWHVDGPSTRTTTFRIPCLPLVLADA